MIIDQIDERSATEGSTQPMPSIDLVLRYTYLFRDELNNGPTY